MRFKHSLLHLTHRNSMEVIFEAVFATLPLQCCDCQVHHRPLNGKLSSISSKAQQAILAWLHWRLGDVAQVPCQGAPVHWPAGQVFGVSLFDQQETCFALLEHLCILGGMSCKS